MGAISKLDGQPLISIRSTTPPGLSRRPAPHDTEPMAVFVGYSRCDDGRRSSQSPPCVWAGPATPASRAQGARPPRACAPVHLIKVLSAADDDLLEVRARFRTDLARATASIEPATVDTSDCGHRVSRGPPSGVRGNRSRAKRLDLAEKRGDRRPGECEARKARGAAAPWRPLDVPQYDATAFALVPGTRLGPYEVIRRVE